MHPYFESKQEHIYISYNHETYNFPAHFHNFLEIAFCFSGIQCLKIGDTVHTLKAGDAAIIFPKTVHEYIAYDGTCPEPSESVALICNTKFLSESIPEVVSMYPENPYIEAKLISENTPVAFRNILSAKDNIELLGWTYIVLSDLMNILSLVPSGRTEELPSKIIAYINDNFRENLTLKHIAKTFGYNTSYIAHLFCDQLKIPFRTYLNSVRLEYAASLIKTTGKSLTEIACDSGYDSLNTFCRCFKKHFSKTPSAYRKGM